jgi:integrase
MWTPHQLRHTATTRAAKEFGIEIAKAATGHAHISTTQIYAERDLDAAKRVALKFGWKRQLNCILTVFIAMIVCFRLEEDL